MADENQTEDEGRTVTIKISKDNTRFGNRVPVSVNGVIAHLPIDKDVPVGKHVIEALKNAEVEYTLVSSEDGAGAGDEGVSDLAPIENVEGSAQRREVVLDQNETGEDAGETVAREQKPDGLKQDNGTVHISGEIPASATAVGGTGGDNAGNTAAETADDTENGANANGTGGGTRDADDADKGQQEPGLLDKSIPDLATALENVTDQKQIEQLIADETKGKSRAGALAVLQTRQAELAAKQ